MAQPAFWTTQAARLVTAGVSSPTQDDSKFRTPPLRNVAVTGPWLHDGSAITLEDALDRHPTPVSPTQASDLIAFLESLTDTGFVSNKRLGFPSHVCGQKM
ncbi:MAG: hypothetical protein QHC67_13635 [Sphingobium sp.]|uniref:hypothetical protein n=1 Tax=Sphingobium sp. TaxID=1912891 RepID=UPI0029B6CF60|nr:hypothetical protein [Sphingobium sp.]MDX3910842.1 hypothetical protein [Sphingobium sp.]